MNHQDIDAVATGQRQFRVLRRGQQLLLVVDVVKRITGVGLRLAELLRQEAHQLRIPISAAELVVTVSGHHCDRVLRQPDDRGVEGATAEVVDEHGRLGRAVLGEPVGEGGRCGLVDDVQHVQPGERTGQLRRLALLIAEIGRDGDDHVRHRGSGRPLGVSGEGLEHKA